MSQWFPKLFSASCSVSFFHLLLQPAFGIGIHFSNVVKRSNSQNRCNLMRANQNSKPVFRPPYFTGSVHHLPFPFPPRLLGLLPLPFPDGRPVLLGAFLGDLPFFAMISPPCQQLYVQATQSFCHPWIEFSDLGKMSPLHRTRTRSDDCCTRLYSQVC